MNGRFGIDTLIADAKSGSISRRDIIKGSIALGMGPVFGLALAGIDSADAQDTVSLSYDAGATQGGGGKPNAALPAYSYVVNGGSQFEINRMVDAALVTVKADLSDMVGDLAESWEITEKTATFKLVQNATWHDGTPLTAKDVVFTFNLLTDPATTSRWASTFQNVVGYDELQSATTPTSMSGITAPDDFTVQLEFARPDSALLAQFPFIQILPEHILGTADRATITELPFWTTNQRVGAGPFKFEKLVEGERVELTANEGYHHGAPSIKNVNLLFFSSVDTSLTAFLQGSSLAAPMTANDMDTVNAIEGAEVVPFLAGVGMIEVNLRQEYLSDKRIRQAIAYAIDKNSIAETIYMGAADAVSTEIPYIEWAQPTDANPYDYDPEKAKQLLQEAGWTGEHKLGFWYYYPDPITAAVMEAMQQFLQAVGIETELKFNDGSGAFDQEAKDHTWDLDYASIGAQASPANLLTFWGPTSYDYTGYVNGEFESEMKAALATFDQTEQATHYQNAVRILNEDLPSVWLFNRKNLLALRSSQLQNTVWGPGHILWRNFAEKWVLSE